jgi:hypothetical protein
MKSNLSILSDNKYVELMYFSEDLLVVRNIPGKFDFNWPSGIGEEA